MNFNYPIKYDTGWHFEKPCDVLGGWKSWFYKKWSVKESTNNSTWHGIIIFGFMRNRCIYNCNKEMAYKEFQLEKQRLINFVSDLIDNPNKIV